MAPESANLILHGVAKPAKASGGPIHVESRMWLGHSRLTNFSAFTLMTAW
jgi:hypothetical protein